ncbi:MAG TPA: hypothetical protein VNI01_00820, partial [Elusimicrobiota bacterium]|nr:hypothetical protein [Elusimicrobiota bacterium]
PRLLGDSAPLLRRFSDERPPAPARPAPAAERLSAIPQPEEPAPTLPTGLLLGGALVAVGAALLALRPWSRRPAPRRVDWSRFADGRPIGLVRPPATGR